MGREQARPGPHQVPPDAAAPPPRQGTPCQGQQLRLGWVARPARPPEGGLGSQLYSSTWPHQATAATRVLTDVLLTPSEGARFQRRGEHPPPPAEINTVGRRVLDLAPLPQQRGAKQQSESRPLKGLAGEPRKPSRRSKWLESAVVPAGRPAGCGVVLVYLVCRRCSCWCSCTLCAAAAMRRTTLSSRT